VFETPNTLTKNCVAFFSTPRANPSEQCGEQWAAKDASTSCAIFALCSPVRDWIHLSWKSESLKWDPLDGDWTNVLALPAAPFAPTSRWSCGLPMFYVFAPWVIPATMGHAIYRRSEWVNVSWDVEVKIWRQNKTHVHAMKRLWCVQWLANYGKNPVVYHYHTIRTYEICCHPNHRCWRTHLGYRIDTESHTYITLAYDRRRTISGYKVKIRLQAAKSRGPEHRDHGEGYCFNQSSYGDRDRVYSELRDHGS
jgi:hypothetical protein